MRLPLPPLKLIAALTVAFALALAPGCSKISRPEQDLRQRLAYNEAAARRYQLDSQWWKVFADERLNALVELALANNIDLAQAAVAVNRALYQANLLSVELVPEFSAGLDGRLNKDISSGGPTSRSYDGSLGLSYELDLWRRLADAVSAQHWEAKATAEDLESARLALIGSVVEAYYQLAYLHEAIKTTEEALANYRRVETMTADKYKLGKVTALEPAQARQSRLSAESSLSDYRSQLRQAEATLRDLLNLKPEDSLEVEGAALSDLKPPELNLDIPLFVLANRPDLRAAEFRLERALALVDEAEKGWLPSITLNAALSSGGGEFKNAFNVPVAGGVVSLNLPFLQWDRVRLNLRLAEQDFQAVRLDFEKTLTTALNEVDTYYYSYSQSLRRLEILRRKYAEDVRVSRYYRERYELGASELSDWLGAMNTVYSSRLASLNGLYELVRYETLVYRALAGRYVDSQAPASGSGEAAPSAGSSPKS